jgi:hypothetical protein
MAPPRQTGPRERALSEDLPKCIQPQKHLRTKLMVEAQKTQARLLELFEERSARVSNDTRGEREPSDMPTYGLMW